jgi:hypothetical protein
MKSLGLVIGVLGMLALCLNPAIGIIILLLGALLFIVGSRKERESLEERRHKEMLETLRNK